MATVYLAFGSNLGEREANIRGAVDRLNAGGVHVLKLSSIIETDPVGGPPQGLFLNAVARCETQLSPEDLLRTCWKIESVFGRVRNVVNGPRTLDIDILLYDNLELSTPDLIIPHPRMKERAFVMDPLREVGVDLPDF